MFTIRKSADRGHANHGWLESFHSFSFANYYDPEFIAFRSLRVINEDFIEAGQGFGTHPHRDMEIITYVLEGKLSHKDSMGNGSTIGAGEVQGMSAGSGVTHSEFNGSNEARTHLLQIWIMPHTKNVTPHYGEWVPDGSENTAWATLASENGKQGGIAIHQDAKLSLARCKPGEMREFAIAPGRYGYLHVAKGEVEVAGHVLSAGDAASFDAKSANKLTARTDAEVLLFDLA